MKPGWRILTQNARGWRDRRREVSHLRRWRFLFCSFPVLTHWANLWRASGAQEGARRQGKLEGDLGGVLSFELQTRSARLPIRGTSGSVQRGPANPARPGREQRYRVSQVCRGDPEVPRVAKDSYQISATRYQDAIACLSCVTARSPTSCPCSSLRLGPNSCGPSNEFNAFPCRSFSVC